MPVDSSGKSRVHSDTGKIGCGHVGEDSIVGNPGLASGLGGGALPKGVCGVAKWG